ncbi:MAG: NAD(P)-binding protein, partial [Spirochaetales bacterium]|nr:NAD(P)-binding protein [Spirochaetales bacterium]
MDNYDFVVLGSGLAGLSFAKRISENGNSVLLLEKENIVGGLSRSLHHEGFFLDFCAHRFHTNNIPLLKEVLALPDFKMFKHNKKSRIYMFGKYLKYPFELQNLFRAMPVSKSFTNGISFLWNMIVRNFKKQQVHSYKDWFIYFYGKKLYEIMCYPYTSKIWSIDPAKISADWANERFQGEQMTELIKRVIKKLLTLDFSSYSLEDESLAPDGGSFYYPESGIQELPDAFLRAAKNNGAESETN